MFMPYKPAYVLSPDCSHSLVFPINNVIYVTVCHNNMLLHCFSSCWFPVSLDTHQTSVVVQFLDC